MCAIADNYILILYYFIGRSVCLSVSMKGPLERSVSFHLSPAGRAAHRREGSGALQVHQAPRVSEGGRQAALQRGSHQRHRPGHQTTACVSAPIPNTPESVL